MPSDQKATPEPIGWAILELMGHRRLAGFISEHEVAGKGFIRIDVPAQDTDAEAAATQLYSPAAVYCITPTSEATARAVAANHAPAPVQRWELPAASAAAAEHMGATWDSDSEGNVAR